MSTVNDEKACDTLENDSKQSVDSSSDKGSAERTSCSCNGFAVFIRKMFCCACASTDDTSDEDVDIDI